MAKIFIRQTHMPMNPGLMTTWRKSRNRSNRSGTNLVHTELHELTAEILKGRDELVVSRWRYQEYFDPWRKEDFDRVVRRELAEHQTRAQYFKRWLADETA